MNFESSFGRMRSLKLCWNSKACWKKDDVAVAVRFGNVNGFLDLFLRLAGTGTGLLAGAWFVRVKRGVKDSSDICVDGAVRDGLKLAWCPALSQEGRAWQ